MRKICIAIVALVPALALAEPKSASDWYNEGETQYNLGNFDKAVEAFKKGFSLETNEGKKAAYLFNVAQSYRMANDCKNAYFFYKRFLALKDNDTDKPLSAKMRKEITSRISELEECAQQAATISKKPPNTLRTDEGGEAQTEEPQHKEPRKDTAARGQHGEEDEGEPEAKAVSRNQPHALTARLIGGGTVIKAGSIDVPVQPKVVLQGGYPIPLNPKLTLDVGAAFSFAPVPVNTNMAGMTSKTSQLYGLLANGGLTYEVAPKIAIRGDAGLGVLLFNDAGGSKFTGNAPTSGALSMFHVRAALAAEYAVTPNLVVTAPSLAFTYSPPKDGLAGDINSIISFDFMVGVGYRM